MWVVRSSPRTNRGSQITGATLLAIGALVAGCAGAPTPETRPPEDPESSADGPHEPAVPEDEAAPPAAPQVESAPPEPDPDPSPGAGAVSAGDEVAVSAGIGVLAAGGNAIDAAIATAFAVAVAEPFASGVGGGGAAIVVAPGEDPLAYDYREVVASDGAIPATNTGVPGFVAGMERLHEDHGQLAFSQLLQPAIALAREGIGTSSSLATQLQSGAGRLPVDQLPHFYPDTTPLAAGETLVQEDLAQTLEHLADNGPRSFYEGQLADQLVNADGLDATSLATYRVQRSPPPSSNFAGYQLVTAAPPLPGVSLNQMLQVLEALGIANLDPDSADFIHAIAMAWRIAESFLVTDLGDPDFFEVPVADLIDRERNAALAEQVSMDTLLTHDPRQLTSDPTGNTTHLTVVDADGMMVSMTNTLTNFWGSGQYELGFFLNDQLRRFSIGQGEANEPSPGRRSVSWSLPAVVLDEDGRPVLGLGSPGGQRIPTVLTQVLIRWALLDQTLEEAVQADRFHLENDDLLFERLPTEVVADDLRARGYASLTVPPQPYYFGSVQALEVDPDSGEVAGAVDPRRDGAWALEPG